MNDLYNAQDYMYKLYFRCTKQHMHTKEKYGTIRYEYTWSWIEGNTHASLFKRIIQRAVKKYPQAASAIVSDAGSVLNDEYFAGWCQGVHFLATGEKGWISDRRPYGV